MVSYKNNSKSEQLILCFKIRVQYHLQQKVLMLILLQSLVCSLDSCTFVLFIHSDQSYKATNVEKNVNIYPLKKYYL